MIDNFVLTFGLISVFFLALWFYMGKEQREAVEWDGTPTPFIDQANRFFSISFAILSLIIMFYFAWLSTPNTTSQTITNTYANFSVNNVLTPYVSSQTITTTNQLPTGENNMATGMFTIMSYLALAFFAIYIVTSFARIVQTAQRTAEMHQQGEYNE